MISVTGCTKNYVPSELNLFCITYPNRPAVNIRLAEDGWPRDDNAETIEEAIALEAVREDMCQ